MKSHCHLHRFNATLPASRLVLGLLVCVSLLQIPLPMLHNHDRFAVSGELAVHVDRQHHDEELDGNEFHWHLMLPRDFDGDGDQSDDGLPLDVVVEAASVDSSGNSIPCQSDLETGSLLLGFAASHSAAPSPSRQTGSCRLPADVSPAERTCAVLCVMQV